MQTRTLDVPLVVFGFNRPHYMEAVCRGLLAQRHVAPDPAKVHLMQDGAVSARTGRRYAEEAGIAETIAVFRRHFPAGQVHASPHNLGIAENIRRGQHHVFEALGYELAYFFEDDLEPGPLYLHALETLRARTEPHAAMVGPFAAYGDHTRQLPGPRVGYGLLGHHWGFGLRRAAWRRIQAWLAPWWEVIRRADYMDRDKLAVRELWQRGRVALDGDGQDGATELACADLMLARIGTDLCFARYIGEEGQHYNPTIFRKLGFDRMRVAEGEAFDFPPLPESQVRAIAEEALRLRMEFRAYTLDAVVERLRARRQGAAAPR
jgi:hypothetical protein